LIYLLTAIGLSPGGSSTVHVYTQTIHRTIQNKQYIEQHNNFGRFAPFTLIPFPLALIDFVDAGETSAKNIECVQSEFVFVVVNSENQDRI
jgi:hypothetical protein